MYRIKFIFIIAATIFLSQINFTQTEKIPVDKNVTVGTLKNGIKYYILQNKKPEKRAELRLVLNAGSVLEDDNQKGLAHFCEHMAFNGTKHFKKNELVNFLESIGVKFGPELNAFTSFDETVYMLQVPTDKKELVSKAFLVLEDWATGLAFDSSEIEKERGVVIEEWRLGRGAQMRMMDKQLPILFKNSRYADRLTIGDKNILQNCSHSTLKQYYHDWYRPDLMAVVAVGDFDKSEIESLIKKHFEKIKQVKQPRKRELYPVPKIKETLFAIASDKEAPYSSVAIYFKRDVTDVETINDYRNLIKFELFAEMFNARLQELINSPEPPFLYAFAGKGRMVRTSDVYFLQAMVNEGKIEKGLATLLTEAERVNKFGFTHTEFEREKKNIERRLEKELAEKDKTESSTIVWDFVNNYLENEPIPGIENEFNLYKKLLPHITLDEINKLSDELLQKENRVFMINSPEKEGLKIPTEKELTEVINKVDKENISKYVDKVLNQPLVSQTITPSKVISENKINELGLVEWKLANGVRVLMKQTDFKNDEIIFSGFSFGGLSLASDKNYLSASVASQISMESGLGEFNKTELEKNLTGKIVNVSSFVSEYQEGLRGSSSIKDLETLFQLIFNHFKAKRIDSSGFFSFKAKLKSNLENRSNNPQAVFMDTFSVTVNNYHFRFRPWNLKLLDEIEMKACYDFIKDRFADAGDFTFLFVGNFDYEKIKPLVENYLGGLPSINRNENWKDIKSNFPKGIIEKTVKKGIEPKSSVAVSFSGEMEFNRQNEYLLESLMDVMNIRLRESIREEKGGSYGVSIYHQISRIPKSRFSVNINFGCDPVRVEELSKTLFVIIDSVKNFGCSKETLEKVQQTQLRSREVKLKVNGFWNNVLQNYFLYNDNPVELLNYNKWISNLTIDDIKNQAQKYFNTNNYVKVVLLPEK